MSSARQITSSRQSPRISAASAGVDLVPLFDGRAGRCQQPDESRSTSSPICRSSCCRESRAAGPRPTRRRSWPTVAPRRSAPRATSRRPASALVQNSAPRMAGVDVGSQAASDVTARQRAPEDLARPGVEERRARRLQRDRRFFVFVDAEHLETRAAPGRDRPRAGRRRGASPVEKRPLPSSSTTIAP